MCGGSETIKSASTDTSSAAQVTTAKPKDMRCLITGTEFSLYNLLEFASDNNVEGFKRLIDCDASSINKSGLWYVRHSGSKQVLQEDRTPLMVAATYGSVNVLKLLLSFPEIDVNLSSGLDKSTALHCAASGGSINIFEAVNILLSAGADPKSVDANGYRPVDVIYVHPKLHNMKVKLEELLRSSDCHPDELTSLQLSFITSCSLSPALTSDPEKEFLSLESTSSLVRKSTDESVDSTVEKKEYLIDPSLPDIKNSIYATDEFRMFSFKVRPCSRAYSHDWTECPFVHPGENARRRDPRKFHYSCVPCPDFRKGACRRGDMCEYAHGVFECWLHPAQYRTRLCKDGASCDRRVCFFAHATEELRPLYVSTGSAVPSPWSSTSAAASNVMDMAAALSLFPRSPSSLSVMSPSPFSQPMSPFSQPMSPFSQPMSPFSQPMSPSPFSQSMPPSPFSQSMSPASTAWAQPNVPTLDLPGSSFQSSRLRTSLSARDMSLEDLNRLMNHDSQKQLVSDKNFFSQLRPSSVCLSRSSRPKTLTPSNLEELFSSEISSSPQFSDPVAASAFSPTYKSAVLSQFQQQQSMLSHINTSLLSPKTVELPLQHSSLGALSPGRMSPRNADPISPMGSRLTPFANGEKQQNLHCLSSRDLGSNIPASNGSPVKSWSKWGFSMGKADWSVHGDGLACLRGSSLLELGNNVEEPDFSWVQNLVKESPPELRRDKLTIPVPDGAVPCEALTTNSQFESIDHLVLGSLLEQMPA